MVYTCYAVDGKLERIKRNHNASHADDSKTIGQVISNWLTNLFGSNTNLTDVANKPMNDSSKAALQSFLSNVSQTGTPVNGNVVTTTGKQAPQLEVKPQEVNTATSETSSFTTSQYSSSTTWPESSTSYPPEDEKCYTDAVFQVGLTQPEAFN
jgi:hypothetical protein